MFEVLLRKNINSFEDGSGEEEKLFVLFLKTYKNGNDK
jgi:hypothetical protein